MTTSAHTGPPWRGIGARISDRRNPDTRVDWEAFERRLSDTTPARANAIRLMIQATGSSYPAVVRQLARRGRLDLEAKGCVLPPWWRLRLAARLRAQAAAFARGEEEPRARARGEGDRPPPPYPGASRAGGEP